jgi:hypothetical protein
MSTYLNLQNDPGELAGIGIALKALATTFGTDAKAILADIESIEAGRPWGADGAGDAFLHSYNHAPATGGAPFAQSLRDELAKAGTDLGQMGDGVVLAMADFELNDVMSAQDIKNV